MYTKCAALEFFERLHTHTYLHGGNLTCIETQRLRKRGGYGATACANVEERLEVGVVATFSLPLKFRTKS